MAAAVHHERDARVLEEQINALVIENEKLKEKLKEAIENPSKVAGILLRETGLELNALRVEFSNLETSRDEYKAKAELLEKEIFDMQSKNSESGSASGGGHFWRDRVDTLKDKIELVEVYENLIESYRIELSDRESRINKLEEKKSFFLEKCVELEEELEKCGSLKNQVRSFKEEIEKLKADWLEETRRAKRFLDKLNAFKKEKDKLTAENNTLSETLDHQTEEAGLEIEKLKSSLERAERNSSDKDQEIETLLEKIKNFKNVIQEAMKNI